VGDWDHNLYRNFRWWEIGITISTVIFDGGRLGSQSPPQGIRLISA
jgi:hypothetical protein